MTRDATAQKIEILVRRVDDLSRALGSQVTIVEELRASHDISIRRIADAFNVHNPDVTLGAVLASIEPPRPE